MTAWGRNRGRVAGCRSDRVIPGLGWRLRCEGQQGHTDDHHGSLRLRNWLEAYGRKEPVHWAWGRERGAALREVTR